MTETTDQFQAFVQKLAYLLQVNMSLHSGHPEKYLDLNQLFEEKAGAAFQQLEE